MIKCNNCGQEIPDNVSFCPECGARHDVLISSPPSAQQLQHIPADSSAAANGGTQGEPVQTNKINEDMLSKAAYLGALLVLLSSFFPFISILGGLGSFSISEISAIVTVAIIAFAAIAIYCHMQGQVDIMPIIGTGLLLSLAVGFVEYHSAMDEVSKLFGSSGKAVAKAAFTFSAGFYAYIGGSILMCLGGSGCLAYKMGISLDFSGIILGWKEALQRTVIIGSMRLPGWGVSLIVTGILVLLVKNVDFK